MLETAFEAEIFGFAHRHEWNVVHGCNGSTGSYWIKDGRYRMVSIEPKSYGWLIGIGNQLFVDIEDPATCMLKPPVGEYYFVQYKRTKHFWSVKNRDALLAFFYQ
jgi:hypothetical protein